LVEYTNTVASDDDEHGEGRISQPALMRGVVSDVILSMHDNLKPISAPWWM